MVSTDSRLKLIERICFCDENCQKQTVSSLVAAEENADSFRFLARTSQTSEWLWKIYFNWIAAILVANVIIAPIILYYLMINGNLNADNFFRPIPFVWVCVRFCVLEMSQFTLFERRNATKKTFQFTVESNHIFRVFRWIGTGCNGHHWLHAGQWNAFTAIYLDLYASSSIFESISAVHNQIESSHWRRQESMQCKNSLQINSISSIGEKVGNI